MKTDFEHWLAAQFAHTGPFTVFIVPGRTRAVVAARKLKEVEADVKADPLTLNRGLFFDRESWHLRIDEATA